MAISSIADCHVASLLPKKLILNVELIWLSAPFVKGADARSAAGGFFLLGAYIFSVLVLSLLRFVGDSVINF